jgi:riboflavin kinase
MPPNAAEHVAEHEVRVRPMIVGPDAPESPYPIALTGDVQKGFGRGGKDLGCPTGLSYLSYALISNELFATANLPDDSITPLSSVAKTGVYYGFAQVVPPPEHAAKFNIMVLPMVMSLGWNPFYKNERLSAVNGHFL